MQLVDRDAAVGIIHQLAKDYMEAHGEPPRTINVVGGTAMSLRQIRDKSEDVNIFYPDDAFRTIAEDLESGRPLERGPLRL
jgi:diaminopimelate decarboxylase